jgi:23S rRNA (pseudouridine1915-N3)-methyltransferase
MKLHLVTVGKPKLVYASLGWDEYFGRLGHYHGLRTTQLPDKHNDASHLLEAVQGTYVVALDSGGKQFTSVALAEWLEKRELDAKEVSFVIGGPDGLPPEVLDRADQTISFGQGTLPHDLAMIVLLESLYRASTINAGHPYHR